MPVTDARGKTVPHLLLHDGDWVRVKALADVQGANAHFVYGPPKPPDSDRAVSCPITTKHPR